MGVVEYEARAEMFRMAMVPNEDVRKDKLGKEVLTRMSELECRCTIRRERYRMTLGHWKEVTKGGGSLVSSGVWLAERRRGEASVLCGGPSPHFSYTQL